MAVDIGRDRYAEPEEPQLGVFGDRRRPAPLAVDIDPPARCQRIDRPAERGCVELVEAETDRVRRIHHDRLRQLADIVGEDTIRFQVGGGDGQGRGELDVAPDSLIGCGIWPAEQYCYTKANIRAAAIVALSS